MELDGQLAEYDALIDRGYLPIYILTAMEQIRINTTTTTTVNNGR